MIPVSTPSETGALGASHVTARDSSSEGMFSSVTVAPVAVAVPPVDRCRCPHGVAIPGAVRSVAVIPGRDLTPIRGGRALRLGPAPRLSNGGGL